MERTNVKKNKQGYGYKYTDIAAINDFLHSMGIGYSQYIETCDINGEDYIYTVPVVGGEVQPPRRGCRVPSATLSGKSNPAQEYGSALTYARRYSLLLAFGLATEDDDAECMTLPDGLTETQIKAIKAELDRTGISEEAIYSRYGKNSIAELTQSDYARAIKGLSKSADKEN